MVYDATDTRACCEGLQPQASAAAAAVSPLSCRTSRSFITRGLHVAAIVLLSLRLNLVVNSVLYLRSFTHRTSSPGQARLRPFREQLLLPYFFSAPVLRQRADLIKPRAIPGCATQFANSLAAWHLRAPWSGEASALSRDCIRAQSLGAHALGAPSQGLAFCSRHAPQPAWPSLLPAFSAPALQPLSLHQTSSTPLLPPPPPLPQPPPPPLPPTRHSPSGPPPLPPLSPPRPPSSPQPFWAPPQNCPLPGRAPPTAWLRRLAALPRRTASSVVAPRLRP